MFSYVSCVFFYAGFVLFGARSRIFSPGVASSFSSSAGGTKKYAPTKSMLKPSMKISPDGCAASSCRGPRALKPGTVVPHKSIPHSPRLHKP